MSDNAPDRGLSLLGALLTAVYWVDESLQCSLEAEGFKKIPRSWSMVMINVANGTTRPIRIAENMGVSRQAIQKTLEEMSREGLVDVTPDPRDRRATVVSFSPRGRPIQEAAGRILGLIEDVLEQRVGAERLEVLHEVLESDWGELVVSQAPEYKSA